MKLKHVLKIALVAPLIGGFLLGGKEGVGYALIFETIFFMPIFLYLSEK